MSCAFKPSPLQRIRADNGDKLHKSCHLFSTYVVLSDGDLGTIATISQRRELPL